MRHHVRVPTDPDLSLERCVAAARAVRRAEFGRQAYDTVRPRGVSGLVREKGPLFLQLYVAAREGRFVEGEGDAFGLLEPPAEQDAARLGGGSPLAFARFLCRRWELLFWVVPPSIGLGVTTVFLAQVAWTSVLITLLLMLAYLVVLMTGFLVTSFAWLYRTFGRRARRGEHAAETQPSYNWTLRLCHCPDAAHAEELLRKVSHMLRRQIRARARAVVEAQGGRLKDLDVVETLVCLPQGVTTSEMRTALMKDDLVKWPFGPGNGVALVVPEDRGASVHRSFSTAGFFFWYFTGALIATLLLAWMVAMQERSRYEETLRWIVGAGGSFSPELPLAWLLGKLVPIMWLMTIPVAVVAIRQRQKMGKIEKMEFARTKDEIGRRPCLAVFAVTDVEEDAVLAVARRLNPSHIIKPHHLSEHTVLRLGEFGSCDVVFARAGAGPYSARGLLATANSVIGELRPDYVMLTGICFGLKDDDGQRLEDIVIASQARDLDHRKLFEVDSKVSEQPRGDRTGPTPMLYSRVRTRVALWKTEDIRVHNGPMVSSGTLFDSPLERAKVKAAHPDAAAGDMESHVFAAAAYRHGVEWAVVKAISDLGMEKTNEHQMQAALNAADLVFAVAKSGDLAEPPPRPGH